MAIVTCVDCDEQFCSECEGEKLGPSRWLCDSCVENREDAEEKKDADAVQLKEQKPVSCVRCANITSFWIEKNDGPMCVSCAHQYEITLHSAGHEPETCLICNAA